MFPAPKPSLRREHTQGDSRSQFFVHTISSLGADITPFIDFQVQVQVQVQVHDYTLLHKPV
jgi:hypothetical protein